MPYNVLNLDITARETASREYNKVTLAQRQLVAEVRGKLGPSMQEASKSIASAGVAQKQAAEDAMALAGSQGKSGKEVRDAGKAVMQQKSSFVALQEEVVGLGRKNQFASGTLSGLSQRLHETSETMMSKLSPNTQKAIQGITNFSEVTRIGKGIANASTKTEAQRSAVLRLQAQAVGRTAQQTELYTTQVKMNKDQTLLGIKHSAANVQTLNMVGSSAHGAMMGMGALNGSLLQVGFSLIFLKFSMVPITLAVSGLVYGFGTLYKKLQASKQATKELQDANKGYRNILATVSGDTGKITSMSKDAVIVQTLWGDTIGSVADAAGTLAWEGIEPTIELLNTLAAASAGSGKSIDELASSIISLLKPGELSVTNFDDFREALFNIIPQTGDFGENVDFAAKIFGDFAGKVGDTEGQLGVITGVLDRLYGEITPQKFTEATQAWKDWTEELEKAKKYTETFAGDIGRIMELFDTDMPTAIKIYMGALDLMGDKVKDPAILSHWDFATALEAVGGEFGVSASKLKLFQDDLTKLSYDIAKHSLPFWDFARALAAIGTKADELITSNRLEKMKEFGGAMTTVTGTFLPMPPEAQAAFMGGLNVPLAQAGGLVTRGGLVNVHPGEIISPAGGGLNITLNNYAPITSTGAAREMGNQVAKEILKNIPNRRGVSLISRY